MGLTRVLGGVSFFSGHFLKTSLSYCTQQDLLLLSPARAAALCFMDLTSPAPVTVSRLSVKPVQGGHSWNVLTRVGLKSHPREGASPGTPALTWGRAVMCRCVYMGVVWSMN